MFLYTTVVAPLTDLLKHNSFIWNAEAFDALKTAMTSLLVLQLPDFSIPFDVETDASGLAVGATLTQHVHHVLYFSKKMSTRMQLASAMLLKCLL